jgi:uncharacterized protein (TIGR02594 family)
MFLGLEEIVGKKSSPIIMNWVRDMNAPRWFDDDDKAWCAVFPNRIFMALGMQMSGGGFDLLRALTFKAWGEEIAKPVPGAVLVFVRPEGGHVGFYISESPTHYQVLGGNQSNKVSLTWIQKSRLVAARWPLDTEVIGQPVLVDETGHVSTNEA